MDKKELEKILPAIMGIAARGAAASAMDMEESADLKKHYPGDEGYDEKHMKHQLAMSEAAFHAENGKKYYDDYDVRSNEDERQRVKAANESLGRNPYSDFWEGWDEETERDKKDYAKRYQAGLAQRSRKSGQVDAPKPDSSTYDEDPQMGDLEARIAQKPRNRPTYPIRDRGGSPESQKERRGQYQSPGRAKPEIGATPSYEFSSKALKKMMDVIFLSKKADPSIAAQQRSAARARHSATQDRIAGTSQQMAGAVQGPADNTAAQIGQGVVDSAVWGVRDLIGERKQEAKEEAAKNMPSPSGGDAGAAFGNGNVQDINQGTQANTPKPSGLVGADGKPISTSLSQPNGPTPPIPTASGSSGQKPAFQMHSGKKPWLPD